MNILFLGGNRYFGKKILNSLLKSKHKIYLINRNSQKNKYQNKNLVHLKCDRKNLKKKINNIKKINFDVIFDNIAYELSDVLKLHRLLKNNFKHYIFTSSIISYSSLSHDYEVKEKDWEFEKIIKSIQGRYTNYQRKYAINKIKIENYLLKNKDINSTILRVPAVLGKDDFSKKTQLLLNFSRANIDKKLQNNYIQFIFENDLVNIILKIINKKKPRGDTFNIANKKIKIKDFYTKVNKIKKKKMIKDKEIFNKNFPIPTNCFMNCKKIKKKLKIKFSSIDYGLRQVI